MDWHPIKVRGGGGLGIAELSVASCYRNLDKLCREFTFFYPLVSLWLNFLHTLTVRLSYLGCTLFSKIQYLQTFIFQITIGTLIGTWDILVNKA